MGFLLTIAGWLKPAARVVKKVVDTVNDWVNSPGIADEYHDHIKKSPPINKPYECDAPRNNNGDYGDSPNFWGALNNRESQLSDNLLTKINEMDKKIDQQISSQSVANKQLALQTDFMKLAMSASTFDRYTNNIQLHAANLSIHLQTLRNVKGLTDDVNSLRYGLKRSMGVINHLANIVNKSGLGNVNKLENIDVEIAEGAISLNAAYRAFEQTRDLLTKEITAISDLASQHEADVYRVKSQARELGALGANVTIFLDQKVLPKIQQTKQMGAFLRNQIIQIPIISEDQNTGFSEKKMHDI